uniref:MATH domain-containing protein n=1 Tax=Globodera pallida TaxID=36090 RepID=A0A183CLF0_GLOPA
MQFSTKRRAATKSAGGGGLYFRRNIVLKLEKVSEFAREDGNSRRLGEAVYIRGLPWKINISDPNWRCAGSATLQIVSQMEGKADHIRKISHIFDSKENDWGFAQFMTFKTMMDPKNGWYDAKNDTIILSAEVTADELTGVE